jgi:dTDP-4-dehydrorhamnose reductase
MLHLAAERGRVRVVNDQIGSPSYTPDLANGIWQLLDGAPGGLYQLSNAGEVSYADYAREIFRLAGVSRLVEDVSSEAYGAPARRPHYSTLDNSRAHAHGVAPLRHWKDALAEYLDSCGRLVGSPKSQ